MNVTIKLEKKEIEAIIALAKSAAYKIVEVSNVFGAEINIEEALEMLPDINSALKDTEVSNEFGVFKISCDAEGGITLNVEADERVCLAVCEMYSRMLKVMASKIVDYAGFIKIAGKALGGLLEKEADEFEDIFSDIAEEVAKEYGLDEEPKKESSENEEESEDSSKE